MTIERRPRHPPLDTAGVRSVLDAVAAALAGDRRVRFAVVFGSLARGDAFGDVDVAVSMDEPWGYLDLGELGTRIAERLPVRGVDVEVVAVEASSPSLRWRVAREGKVAYRRESWLYPAFYARAIVEWTDLAAAHARSRSGRVRA